jgi:MFS family permease
MKKNSDYVKLFTANTILQIFYSWMVVYSIVYLNKVIGFDWASIGIILTVMLIPFPIIEWPLGKLADMKYGEKEMMTMSFALLGLSTMALATITSNNLFLWSLALFITRIGAAGAEIMIETYFFKTVKPEDSGLLGFFRITRSLSYFIAPLVTGISLIFSKDQSFIFIILGIICLLAMIPSWTIRDTK